MGDNECEPYNWVHVLLLGWEHDEDDLHGNKAMRLGLQKLENVFRGFFSYTTYSSWRIPIEKPTDALNTMLRAFRDQHDHRRNLLVIYYAGHGATDANRNLLWLWYNNLQDSPRVEWNALQTIFLTDCVADVLLVIDCCNALSAIRATSTVRPASAMLWAACSADTTTPQSGWTSFTENLVAELEDLDAEGMNVEDINTRVVIRMDQAQSHAKLLSRNAPHCVPLSLAQPHRSIRLKRLSRPENEQLQKQTESLTSVVEPQSAIPGSPSETLDEQSFAIGDRALDAHSKGDLSGTETPFGDVAEKLRRLEAASLPAQDEDTYLLLRDLSDDYDEERFETISGVSRNSFNAIYENPTFVRWLSNADPILWIRGRPGSGKSTLMKAIVENFSHIEYLNQPQRRPLVKHFFWAVGTRRQTSFEGFAKHLLYQIIKRAPRAGDYVVRQIDAESEEAHPDTFEAKHLIKILKLLFHDSSSPLFDTLWYIIIDGLDECGSVRYPNELQMAIQLIQDFCQSHSIKIILASRCEPELLGIFYGVPSLQLEDLTANDIEAYVLANLQDPVDGHYFEKAYRIEEFGRLAAQIVRRAQGVFLWVVLIVQEIGRGLQRYETMDQLEERVDMLPLELNDLYRHIMLNPHSDLSSRVFALVFACEVDVIEVESEGKVQPLLSTTGLYFALTMNTTEVIDAKIKIDRPELVHHRADRMSKILWEATQGLIIPEKRQGQTVSWPEDGKTISYVHKTAYDFLTDFNVRKDLQEQQAGDGFHPQLALLRAMIRQLKAQDHGTVESYTLDDLSRLRCWSKIEQAMRYAESALEFAPDEAMELLQEMDRVVTYQLTKWSDGSLNHHWSEFLPLGRWRSDDERGTFLSFATSCGLYNYLQLQYDKGCLPRNKPGRPLLDYAIHPNPHFKGHSRNSLTVKFLLEHGANPNELVTGQTVYYRLLLLSCQYHDDSPQTDWSKELNKMRILFRSHGAQISTREEERLRKGDVNELSTENLIWLWHELDS